MGAERWDEQVGSVADEAARLLESLRRSAADAAAVRPDHPADPDGAAAPPAGAAADPIEGATAAHDPFCTWCPLCRSATVVRSLSPETLTRLADLASAAATVLTDLAGSRSGGTGQGAPPRRDPATPSAPESHPIPIHDAEDPQEAPRG